jgi:hypothetical protein
MTYSNAIWVRVRARREELECTDDPAFSDPSLTRAHARLRSALDRLEDVSDLLSCDEQDVETALIEIMALAYSHLMVRRFDVDG